MLDTDVVLMLRNSQNPSDFVTFSTLFNADPEYLNKVEPTLKYWLE